MSAQIRMTAAQFRLQYGNRANTHHHVTLEPLEPDDRPEAIVLAYIRPLAKEYGWMAEYSWDEKQRVVQCLLVRECLIVAHLLRPHAKLVMAQQTWLDALRRVGVEVHVWTPNDRDAIQERLSRKETP
jgi:hypothetical protein